jgi:hypothetical protein
MYLKRLIIHGFLITGVIIGIGTVAIAEDDAKRPPQEQVEFAQRTGDLLQATLFAALTQEFDETKENNVEEGKRSISLVFNDRNKDMRLVGTVGPLKENDRPQDAFEHAALELAMKGQPHTDVQQVEGRWYFRRSIPLSNFRSECALCHTNYPAGPTKDYVGALMLRVPIE